MILNLELGRAGVLPRLWASAPLSSPRGSTFLEADTMPGYAMWRFGPKNAHGLGLPCKGKGTPGCFGRRDGPDKLCISCRATLSALLQKTARKYNKENLMCVNDNKEREDLIGDADTEEAARLLWVAGKWPLRGPARNADSSVAPAGGVPARVREALP